jgi:hypothetical protein
VPPIDWWQPTLLGFRVSVFDRPEFNRTCSADITVAKRFSTQRVGRFAKQLEIATGVSGHGGKLALARPTKVPHLRFSTRDLSVYAVSEGPALLEFHSPGSVLSESVSKDAIAFRKMEMLLTC